MNRFNKETYTCLDMDNFNENDYFSEYPYFEIYDYNKNYEPEFFHDYKKYGIKKYISVLYEIENINNKSEIKKYVVHEEDITEEDLKELERYCQCENCKSGTIKLCSCCIGCLKSYPPSQSNINRAREIKYGF